MVRGLDLVGRTKIMKKQKMGRDWIVVLFLLLLLGVVISAAEAMERQFSVDDGFNKERDTDRFKFLGQATVDGGALQVTHDTLNRDYLRNNSGRIFWRKPFKLWDEEDDAVASFSTSFVINIYRLPEWNAGEGFAFVIAPNLTIPEASFGQWLGLSNATTDGDGGNQIVAVEFDTEKQDEFDPDDNHIGLNINSVRSNKTVSLSGSGIEISPETGTNYSVWIQYDGRSKVLEVYMAEEGNSKPNSSLLSESINLKHYVKKESYFGFSASTGDPAIQLNCVLKWTFDIEILPGDKGFMWWILSIPAGILILVLVIGVVYLKRKKQRAERNSKVDLQGSLRRLTGMPREFRYKDLKKATKNFHESMKLGEGGFGVVYRGVLHEDGDDSSSEIAVKQFSRDDIKGKGDFMAELTIIHRLRHKHLVRLVGNFLPIPHLQFINVTGHNYLFDSHFLKLFLLTVF